MFAASDCGVRITQVRVANFRSLENIEVDLDDLTVLVGANNSGKTSFLEAMFAAIGAGRRLFGKEDIHLKSGETSVPIERKAVVDIRVQPFNEQIIDLFPLGSFWIGLWGKNIVQDQYDNDFIGIRTELAWNETQSEYRLERKFLKQWKLTGDWLTANTTNGISIEQLEPILLYYMNAQRDIKEDLHTSGSFWQRLVNDLGLPEESVLEIEQALSTLNARMVEESSVLKHIQKSLMKMNNVVTTEQTEITPVSRHLRDLAKGMDIQFATSGAQSFPLAKHGMGTRSLASILVFRAFASWKALQASSNQTQIHTLLGLEEPEAHLHPQAQRALFHQIKEIKGQRILSTHSPYFAGQAKLEALRLFQKKGSSSEVSRLDISNLKPDEIKNLKNLVILTRGDILFCRALILFEGQTEELALPVYAEAYWGMNIHELGFNFISVGGSTYYPFVWLAKYLNIKWYIFSDGEETPKIKLNKSLEKAEGGNAS
ncbi:MAG: AAA family ATPase, partial [Magnetococcales bacterium]|nr:AAA family ATPase [Magnetococcales bacterium]